jgi:hypothetical protein
MGKYLDILAREQHRTCDISDISDQSPPPATERPPFGRLNRFGRTFAVLEARCPDGVPTDRWQQCVDDGRTFLTRWGHQAFDLGWTAKDLFGLFPVPENPHPSFSRLSRYDQTGLVWLLDGRPVIALTDSTAAIRSPTQAITIYRRCA